MPESFLLGMLTCGAFVRWKPWVSNTCWRWGASSSQFPAVFKASEFQNLFEEGPMEAAYANTVLATMNQQRLGMLCQEWARETLQRIHPKRKFMDPEVGMCCNGQKRGMHRAAYDFLMDGQRVEVKSARMTWVERRSVWQARFWRIKFPLGQRLEAPFDDLYLVVASPEGLLLIKHDLCTGIQSDGRRTEVAGHRVDVAGGTKDIFWVDALSTIVDKLCKGGSCQLVAQAPLANEHFQQLSIPSHMLEDWGQTTCFERAPLHNMNSVKRGLLIQKIGFVIDQRLNPKSRFELLKQESNLFGDLRGTHNAFSDWIRDGVNVEVKSSKLGFSKRGWCCHWAAIKPKFFDELWLAIFNPWGVRFYTCSCLKALPLQTSGVATEDFGLKLQIYGPCNERDPWQALQVIESKLLSRGCTPVALVEWDSASDFSG